MRQLKTIPITNSAISRSAERFARGTSARIVAAAVLLILTGTRLFASALDPQDVYKAFDLSKQAYESSQKKDYVNAISLYRKALELDNKNDNYWRCLSWNDYMAGQYDDGVKSALQAIALGSHSADTYTTLACIQLCLGDIDSARDAFKFALTLPISPEQSKYATDWLSRLAVRKFRVTVNLAMSQESRIPMPPAKMPFQDATFTISGASYEKTYLHRNTVLVVTPLPDTDRVSVEYIFVTRPYSFARQIAAAKDTPSDPNTPLPSDVSTNLASARSAELHSDIVKQVVSELRPATTVADRAAAISEWLSQHIQYLRTDDDVSVDEIIERGHGQCIHFAQAFRAIARVEGIPARVVQVLFATDQAKQTHGLEWHAIDEFYVAGVGWVPIDPQDPHSLGFIPTDYLYVDHYQDGNDREVEGELGQNPAFVEVTEPLAAGSDAAAGDQSGNPAANSGNP